jgi:hypothetical protein
MGEIIRANRYFVKTKYPLRLKTDAYMRKQSTIGLTDRIRAGNQRPRRSRPAFIIEKRTVPKYDATTAIGVSFHRRRNSRAFFDYWRCRQVRPSGFACLQPDLLGNHTYQVEFATPGALAERKISPRFS